MVLYTMRRDTRIWGKVSAKEQKARSSLAAAWHPDGTGVPLRAAALALRPHDPESPTPRVNAGACPP